MKKFNYADYAKKGFETDATLVKRAIGIIQRTVRLHGPRLAQREVDGISPKPVDRGTYRRSFHVEKIPTGAVIFNSAPHAAVIEYGRRAGSRPPPIDAIADWVLRKGLLDRKVFTKVIVTPSTIRSHRAGRVVVKLRRRRRTAELKKQARALAFVIARSIARRGLPAQRILELAARDIDKEVQAALRKGLAPGK